MSEQIFYQHPKLPGLELRYGDDNRACYGLHTHSEYSFGAVLDGEATYQYCNQTYHIRRGDTLLIAPNLPHACNRAEPRDMYGDRHDDTSGDNTWRYLMLYITAYYWQQLLEQFIAEPRRSNLVANGKPCHQPTWFRGICDLHTVWQTQLDDALAIETAWLDCFQLVVQGGVTAQSSAEAPTTLKQALTWLDAHLTENFSLSEWANAVGSNRVQLLRLFRDQLHISPHQYCLNRRIQQAKILLKQGAPLDETAYELGFADQAHFQRTFKRYTAITPRQYQRNR